MYLLLDRLCHPSASDATNEDPHPILPTPPHLNKEPLMIFLISSVTVFKCSFCVS